MHGFTTKINVMATFKATIFTGGRHIKQDGTTNIKIRVYHQGNAQYLPTQYFIEPTFFNQADGSINQQANNSDSLNYEIGKITLKYQEIYLKLGSERTKKMNCNELKEELIKSSSPETEFIDFVKFARAEIAKTVKRKTADWYQSSLNAFISFYGTEKIEAKDIKTKVLESFMEFLSKRKIVVKKKDDTEEVRAIEPGTINNYMRGIRSLYNKAKRHYNNEDFDIIKIPNNPFSKIQIPEYIRKRKNLRVEDIIRIRDTKFEGRRANMARDVFMMLFYLMGINMNDFFSLTKETYGRIEYERSKVATIHNKRRVPLSIRIEPELRPLLDRYSNGTFLSYFKMNYSNFNNFLKAVNIGLKEVSTQLNLGVPLSTNWARHTWASIGRNCAGIAKADIDFCLGHANNDYKMADIYIDIDYSICDKANRAILDLLKKKK